MATAKDDLAEIPGAGTVREAVVELYDNPDKYIGLNEQSLRRNPSDFLTGLSRMERNALGLFQAVNAWEPVYGPVDQEEFLTRLGPFLDKKLDMNKPASFFSVVIGGLIGLTSSLTTGLEIISGLFPSTK